MLLFFQDSQPLNIVTIIAGFLGSAALGSLIALVGIWLQNRAQEQQLKIAREMEMRREIYFLGAEALGKMQAYLVSLANPLMLDDDRNKIVAGVNESVNKVVIIASLEILTELDKVQAHYSASSLTLITNKLEFTTNANQLRSDEEAHNNLGQHLTQITTALNTANQQRNPEQQSKLIAQYNELDLLYKQQEADLRSRRANTLNSIQSLIGDAIEAAIKFNELAAPLNCRVREELGFPIDETSYLSMLGTASLRQRVLAEKWKEDWHDKFRERVQDSPFDVILG